MSWILIVTMAPTISEVAKHFEAYDHEVTIVRDGIKALAEIDRRGHMPAVVFTDLLVPNLDGAELAIELQRRFTGSEQRIVFATVMTEWGVPVCCWDLPVASIVMIPHTTWQVILAIEQILCRHVSTDSQATTVLTERAKQIKDKLMEKHPLPRSGW